MIVIFLLLAGDSLGLSDTLPVLPDTTGAAAVAPAADTVRADSVWIYEVPKIVTLDDGGPAGAFAPAKAYEPGVSQYTVSEIFANSPYFQLKKGNAVILTSRSCDPLVTRYFFNGHAWDDRLRGFTDLNAVPVSVPDRLGVSRNAGLPDVNFIGKVNKYERPFSALRFTTLGDNTIYNIDFTRALTNDLGLYFSGLYSNLYKSQDGLYHKLNAYYGNLYYNQFLPARFDLLYSSSAYGTQENNSVVDISGTADILQNNLCVYYSRFSLYRTDTIADTLDNASENVGFVAETSRNTPFFDLYVNLRGSLSRVATDLEGTFESQSGAFFAGLSRSWHRLFIGAGNSIDSRDDENMRLSPRLMAAYNLYDSTFVTGSISHGFREPVISETEAPIDTAAYHPNPDLKTESWWNREIGLKRGNFSVAVYNMDFNNYIVWAQPDPWNYYAPQNQWSRSFSGAEGTIGLSLGKFLLFKFAGNYLFDGEPDDYLPSRHLGSSITLKHETVRAMQAITVQWQYIGERAAPYGPGFPDAGVVSVIGAVRFITLTAVLKIENLLDQDVPFTPVPKFNTSLSLKWEFWD